MKIGFWYHSLLDSALLGSILLGACLAIGAGNAAASDTTPGESTRFPFVISYDAPDNVTNIAAWLETPAGTHGFVRAEMGQLMIDTGPIRLWGTNFCYEACFPTHEEAERVADRLARFGMNCVRMHHMDDRHIWGDSPNRTIIDPKMLEKLDYFIYQLKQRGIYTNLNLHVSRTLGKAEGFSGKKQRPTFDKGVGNFEPRMIALQKKYAHDLLTHVNPYTQLAYKDDPAVAMVEISNEDALLNSWNRSDLDNLPEPYATTFRKQWNAWLRKKYGGTRKLKAAWGVGDQPLGKELLADGKFEKPLGQFWLLQTDAQSEVDAVVASEGPDDCNSLRLNIKRLGQQAWIPQLMNHHVRVEKGKSYTLSGYLRCGESRKISVNCMMAHAPWQPLGLQTSVAVGPKWKRFALTFIAKRSEENARITLSGFKPGIYELAALSLRPGGVVGLIKGTNLEDSSVPVLKHNSLNTTETARNDFIDFLWDTEHAYWTGMFRFLKEELQVRSLVSGTQLGYGPTHIQAELDYLDAHAYWQHPVFPGRPWDQNNWFVRNVALTNAKDGGTLTRLAARRVAGKAYTVSEYNHPTPNFYAAEGFPMLASFGRFQKWNGIFQFTYSHDRKFQPRSLNGFFNVNGHPAKLAHMIACTALFLRGDADEARKTVTVAMTPEMERDLLHKHRSGWSLSAQQLGLDLRTAMRHAIALDLNASTVAPPPPSHEKNDAAKDATKEIVSDTGQLRWNFSDPQAGFFIADTPRTKIFTGFVRDRVIAMGDIHLKIGKTQHDWATISMTAIDGNQLFAPGRILLAATGDVRNTDAQLHKLRPFEAERITLGADWGKEPVLCEGIPALVLLPLEASQVRLYRLDESGNRQAPIPVTSRKGKTLLRLAPKHKTLWYEVEILP